MKGPKKLKNLTLDVNLVSKDGVSENTLGPTPMHPLIPSSVDSLISPSELVNEKDMLTIYGKDTSPKEVSLLISNTDNVSERTIESVTIAPTDFTRMVDIMNHTMTTSLLDDNDRRPRENLTIKEVQKVFEVKTGDRHFVEEEDKKVASSGIMKTKRDRVLFPKKRNRYRAGVQVHKNLLDLSNLVTKKGTSLTRSTDAKKNKRYSNRSKEVGKNLFTGNVVSVRVITKLDNNSRLVGLGPVRGIVPISQLLLPRMKVKEQTILRKRVGEVIKVVVIKPCGYEEPFYASHRDGHPKYLHPEIREYISSNKKLKKLANRFNEKQLQSFYKTMGVFIPEMEEFSLIDVTPSDWILLLGKYYLTIEKDPRSASGMITLLKNLPELRETLNDKQQNKLLNYIYGYIFVEKERSDLMIYEEGVEAYEYMDDLSLENLIEVKDVRGR